MTTIGNALNLNFIANQLIYSPTATTLAGLNLPLTVPHGGTGLTTGSVPYTVICAGTTATGAFQPVPAIGPAGQVLTSNGPGALPNWQPGGGGGGLTWAPVQTSDFNATSNTGYPVNTTSNPITATLPATPTVGNNIIFTDYAGTWNVNALTINPNGNKLEGSSSNYVINVSYGSVSIVFVDPIQGWLLYSSGNGIFNNVPANSALVSSGASVPNWNTTLPTAVQGNITSLGTISSIGAPLGAAFGGTGVTNGATSTITLGGPFTMSGAFSFTGTLTNTTAVTFPTSGTLATTSQIPAFPLSLANGGTNANLTASNGGIFYSTATAGAILSGTATANQVLLSGSSTTPAWSTATYPATTTINQVLYSNAANTITGLATANTSCLTTNGSGVPSWNTTLPTAVQGNITSLGTISSIGAPLGAAFGGTGLTTTTTPYGVVCAGTSTTSALQVLNSLGSSGQLLTSNGPSALPSWQSVAGSSGRLLNVQVFTSGSGTYTATAGTNNIIVQCLAGGGGGGGAAATSGQLSAGGGGGAGGYSLLLVTGSSATYAYAVGAGGAGGAAGQNNGIVGGNSTFGTLITATGGGPGGAGPALSSSGLSGVGGAAGTSTGGNYNIAGGIGQWGYGIAGGASFPGTGGISIFGSGTFGLASFTTENGTASPANTGAGGSAGATFNSGAASGGDGGSGIIIVWEYT